MESLPCTHIPREQFAQSPCVCKRGPATRRSTRKRGKLRTPGKPSTMPSTHSRHVTGAVIACRAFKSTRKVSSFSLFSMSEVRVASHKLG